MRSPLRDLSHVGDLPGHFDFDAREDEKSERIFLRKARAARTLHAEQEAWLAPELRPYLLDRHHDGWILRIVRERDRLTLVAEDVDLNVLASARYGLDASRAVPTFEILFEGVVYATHRRSLPNGRLSWAPEPRETLQRYFARFYETELPGVRWILSYSMDEGRCEERHLLVEAERVRVVPYGRARFVRDHGANAGVVFDRYEAVREGLSLRVSPGRMNEVGVEWPPRGR